MRTLYAYDDSRGVDIKISSSHLQTIIDALASHSEKLWNECRAKTGNAAQYDAETQIAAERVDYIAYALTQCHDDQSTEFDLIEFFNCLS